MAYFTWNDLTDLLGEEKAVQALDDDSDGTPEKWESVRDAACRAVDARIMAKVDVPLTADPPPALIIEAAVLECGQACYARRDEGDAFPFRDRLKSARTALDLVGAGKMKLFPTAETRTPAAAITEPARSYSEAGRLPA